MLEKLFGKKISDGEFIELDTASVEAPSGKIPIKIEKLADFIDTDKIQKSARNGAIVLVRIKELKEKDLSELKRAIDKLRKTAVAMNGDIVGIDENYILITPNFAHVVRP
ncbi:MAG: cell division protein SepF [Nanoarchaeota archaeon]|nr:cell division protein SepF [Nanoarchaeota archaeon]MBU4124526.1 cell division protein SepF [Nanoarchaeota archaeon]